MKGKMMSKKSQFSAKGNAFHVWIDDYIGLKLKKKQCKNFKHLMGTINSVLEEQYKCQIAYDQSKDNGKTVVNGFAIYSLEGE